MYKAENISKNGMDIMFVRNVVEKFSKIATDWL